MAHPLVSIPLVSIPLVSIPLVSIIVPVLNEAENLAVLLRSLPLDEAQVIVVDGCSTDASREIAASYKQVSLLHSLPGRAKQMNKGAAAARGEVLLFLHADSLMPDKFLRLIGYHFLASAAEWGRFDVSLSGRHGIFRLIEKMINLRSQITAICTGDQGIFVRRRAFKQLGGFPQQPLMEDIAFSKKLKALSAPYCIHTPLTTSSRRWETRGILKTILLMWRLRMMYFFGVSAEKLAKQYYK